MSDQRQVKMAATPPLRTLRPQCLLSVEINEGKEISFGKTSRLPLAFIDVSISIDSGS
jgi:hypothetical protein